MAKRTAEVTIVGTNKLDRKLARLPQNMQRKAIRKATREVAKEYKSRVKGLIPQDTGAMAAAVEVRSITRTIKAGTGQYRTAERDDGEIYGFEVQRTVAKEYGAKAQITRKSLDKQLRKRGLTEAADALMRDGGYFYPALVELGGLGRTADGSMRRQVRALRGFAVREFRKHLAQFIRSQSIGSRARQKVADILGGKKKKK